MRKLTYEFVKEKFEERGYTLLSNIYVNGRTKMDYICPKGHIHNITYIDFSSGRGCPVCGLNRRASKRRLSFSIIEEYFIIEGFKLFEPEGGYINVDQKLDFECPNGHTGSISYHNWKNGWRCVKCHHEKLSLIFLGSGGSNWRGGKSFETYCEEWKDLEYKNSIKERDGYRCLNPYCYQIDNVLSVHHIDYNKKNCRPNNLITVCRSCNSRANKDHRWHKPGIRLF
jgi:hypothetical protein